MKPIPLLGVNVSFRTNLGAKLLEFLGRNLFLENDIKFILRVHGVHIERGGYSHF